MNAEKDQSLELPEVSDHQAQSREPRVITRILCWTFFYAEMLLVCALEHGPMAVAHSIAETYDVLV